MRRFAILFYGILCYAAFLATFVYAAGFVANAFVPTSVDGGQAGPLARALVVDVALLGLFAVQHTGMARRGFKRWLTRFVPREAERSTYVLASVAAFAALFAWWEPIPGAVWRIEGEVGRMAIWGLFGLGIGTILYTTFLIDHFDLFGLRQVVLAFLGRPYEEKRFVTPGPYRHIRHPLYVGWFLFFWSTPDMTFGHLLLAVATTGYILIAIVFEERDLLAALGEDYRRWRAATPMFVPRLRPRRERSRLTAAGAR
jgi:protein-S-isoprenylcysteine O-methyltransferase Ste14